jgi:hypothetical protein
MLISFGKHRGRSVETLVLKEPDYVQWMLSQQDPSDAFAEACEHACLLIERFDAKPLRGLCSSPGCERPPAFASVAANGYRPVWCCELCDPFSPGDARGKFRIVRTFWDAVAHIDTTCDGRKEDLRLLVEDMARAKGLPDRVGEAEALAFFRENQAKPPAA